MSTDLRASLAALASAIHSVQDPVAKSLLVPPFKQTVAASETVLQDIRDLRLFYGNDSELDALCEWCRHRLPPDRLFVFFEILRQFSDEKEQSADRVARLQESDDRVAQLENARVLKERKIEIDREREEIEHQKSAYHGLVSSSTSGSSRFPAQYSAPRFGSPGRPSVRPPVPKMEEGIQCEMDIAILPDDVAEESIVYSDEDNDVRVDMQQHPDLHLLKQKNEVISSDQAVAASSWQLPRRRTGDDRMMASSAASPIQSDAWLRIVKSLK
eukprot:ANDGO_01807.mRNA.1 hypothetical protein